MFHLNMKYLQKIVQFIISLGPSWHLSNKRVVLVWNEQYSNTLGSAVSVKDRRGGEGLTTRQGMKGRRQLENTNKVDYSISGSAAPSAVDSFSELKVTSQS